MKKIDVVVILLVSLVLLLSEQLYRFCFGIPLLTFSKLMETGAIFLVFVSIFRFTKYRFSRYLIILFFFIAHVANNVHYAIYESWLTGMNLYLFFKEFSEVKNAGLPMLGTLLPCILWGLGDLVIFLMARYRRQKTYWFNDVLFVAMMLYIIIRSFSTYQDHAISPKYSYGKIKSAYFSVGYMLGKILPYQWLNLSDMPVYTSNTPPHSQLHDLNIKNIILVMGESESAIHLDTFGYDRKTSPFISQLKDDPNALVRSAYASGFLTSVALPSFFNAIPHPNGLMQIYSGRTNIFNLAQQQHYKTIFHTAQAEYEMAIINLIGLHWMDEITYPTNYGYPIKENMPDNQLLPIFYQMDLDNGKHFVVLHQRGSHAPYGKYLTPEERVFGDDVFDQYDNTIYNTDRFLQKVYEHLSKRPDNDWLLIYTSDHGQYVTKAVANQGTDHEDSYLVPLVIYTRNEALKEKIAKTFDHCQRSTHQQLATFIIQIMGYDMPIADCTSAAVNRMITGDLGYLKIDMIQNTKTWIYPKKH
ncbi:phosphoethanolamine transferase [Basilea psittacipulmonis]|uniref:Sulfatase N-terminal domain-containing protein n=1 Tax=Basilea psittacipulmonis DSM 24701 TaxID=1072685 RepID=A0A077DB11_9BURK|nr:sulfatase-like hydrolase/transferase [Basilea psittacipulmonis]AIL32075.1 hypothetical protein IX83_00925 [Basilea psittacipulmonis DSM 24701]